MLSILISMQFFLQTGASSKASCASTFRYFAESQGLGEEQISYKWHGNQSFFFLFQKASGFCCSYVFCFYNKHVFFMHQVPL